MKNINFTKMVASGNDFAVIEADYPLSAIRYPLFARKICDRKYGAGADGLLVLEKSKAADIRMRIFNADGSEAQMCGNGARCAALYISHKGSRARGHKVKLKIETKAGIIGAEIKGDSVRIKLTDPKVIKLDIPVKVSAKNIKVNFIDTGVPHTVIFSEGLDKIDITALGRQIRYHHRFSPKGTNVDFVEVLNNDSIKVRTYERGVEDETLACGTGSVASALIFALKTNMTGKVNVRTRSRETLRVYFTRLLDRFKDVWLEGKANKVYQGVYNV